MSRARDFADLAGSADAGGLTGRNLLINGAMQVNQRGDQTSSAGSSKYFVDRFNVYIAATAVASLTQSTDVPSGQGFSNSAKIDVTTANASPAASDEAHFRQVLEGQDLQHLRYGTSSAKKLTLSFWVKSSKTGTHIIEFYNAASAGAKQQSQSYTISAADTWEKKSITIDGDTSTIIDNTTSAEFYVQWVLQAGSNFTSGTLNTSWNSVTNANRYVGQSNFFDNTSNNMYITGTQLEVGSATPFEHRSFGDVLKQCERYYEKTYEYGTAPGTAEVYDTNLGMRIVGLDDETSGQRYMIFRQRTEKRARPTNTYYGHSGTSGKISTGTTGGVFTERSVGLSVTSTSMVGAGPSNGAYAGLAVFVVSDAEL